MALRWAHLGTRPRACPACIRPRLLSTTSSTASIPPRPRISSSNAGPASQAAGRRRGAGSKEKGEDLRYNFNLNPFDPAPRDEAARARYPLVTAEDLKKQGHLPSRVRLLTRDFIDDSLYNPHYGYFSKQAVIFDPDRAVSEQDGGLEQRQRGFDFHGIRNMAEWDKVVAETYGIIEETDSAKAGLGRQVWHTPTELFKPHYAQSVAHHLATEYKLSLYPYNDLVIYEIGAGNGSLMAGILDFLAESEPEVYERTRYNIIEISDQLADLQQARASKAGHSDRVRINRQSIFDWKEEVTSPCFFLAFEVLDNLSHDVVRYTLKDHVPLQCIVEIDERGDFSEVYEPVRDPWIAKYLKIRRDVRRNHAPAQTSLHPLMARYPGLRRFYASLPFAPNLSPPDFLPTKSLQLLYKLRSKFPAHKLLMSDFDYLPDTVSGRNAPVVQTRYEGKSVACSTYLVSQGWFDIFFPTDFRLLRDMYDKVMQGEEACALAGEGANRDYDLDFGRAWGNRRPLRILSHRQFLERYGEPENTTLQDGTNPMLDLYENAAFIF